MNKIHRSYFITGATGFLGSNLIRELILNNHTVYCLRRKSSNFIRLNDIFEKLIWVDLESLNPMQFFSTNSIDGIIHCATDYGRKIVDPIQTIEANLILPLRLLHAAAANGISIFLNTDTILDKLINNYSLSKSQFAEWLNSYSDRICGINVVLEHFYGGGDDDTKFTTFVIRSLISKRDTLPLTTGDQKRDFIYIDDVVSALLLILDQSHLYNHGYYRFEIGTGKLTSVREFVNLAKSLTLNNNTILSYGALPYRKGEIMEAKIDNSNIMKLGWRSAVSLEEGLSRTIKFEKFKILK